MTGILRVFIVVVCSLMLSQTNAHTNSIATVDMRYVTISTCELDPDKIPHAEEYRIGKMCNDFIAKYYSDIKFFVFPKLLYRSPGETLRREMNYGVYGTYNELQSVELSEIKDKEALSKYLDDHRIGITMEFDSQDSHANILQLVEYGISQESRFHKRFIKLFIMSHKQDSDLIRILDVGNQLVVENDVLMKVLQRPASRRVTEFLKNYEY